MPEVEPFERLPITVCPENYKINIETNLTKCTFTGSVEIQIKIKEPVKYILLNCLDLTLGDISLSEDDQEPTKPLAVELDSSKETLKLLFNETLKAGTSCLKIAFNGTLNKSMKGLYQAKYTVGDEVRYSAVSQFEATEARRCFPCWDEPAIKATFDITLIVPKDKVALSNMNEVSRESHSTLTNLDVVKFATTPIMPTYLVALVVGEYDFVEGQLPNGIKVRVYTPLGKKEQGLFALEATIKAIPYYTDYFQIPYPLPKIDLIAITEMANGAMENWGLVTYQERLLLVDPHSTSAHQKQNIALVVAHELAHQWFGNLVTMEWWTHLWLNEGYATFEEYLCTDDLFPEFKIWFQFTKDTFIPALEMDALKNSHPIEVPVGHPSEVEEIFDNISYAKGASIVRMIHDYIGDKDYRAGMHLYLSRHSYSNTSTEDLWKALGESSNKPIMSLMSSWTKQSGYPIISVTSRQDGNNRVLTVSQQRFLADGSIELSGSSDLWMVPLSFSTGASPTKSIKDTILQTQTAEIVLENVPSNVWVKLNVGSVGYYRTKYSSEMLAQIFPAITSKVLPSLDRLGILNDLFAAVIAGHTSTTEVLKVLKSYEEETDYIIWSDICRFFSHLRVVLSNTSYQHLATAFAKKLLSKITAKVGWEVKPDENHLDILLRSLVVEKSGVYGQESVYEEAKKRLEAHLNGTCSIPVDLRSAVYRTVLCKGDESTFDRMLKLYSETEFHEEQNRISIALGATSNPKLIQRVLQFAISDKVRRQDSVFIISSVGHSLAGRDAVWTFFKDHIEDFKITYGGAWLMTYLIKYAIENYSSEKMAIEVEKFFQENPIAGTERTIQLGIEQIRLNAAWLKRDSEAIEMFLTTENQA